MATSLVIRRAEVAALLGCTPGWFGDHRRTLEREHGFPRPLPLLHPMGWDPAAVQAWVRAGGQATPPPPPAPPAAGDDDATDWSAVMRARADALRKGKAA